MYMKISLILVVVLLATMAHPSRAFAGGDPEKHAQFASKVKSEIAKLGTGPDARVEVKLRDKTKLKGHISEVGNEFFMVVDDKTGASTTVTYLQVKQVKGNNLATGVKIAIGVGIFLAVFLILAMTGVLVD